MCGGGLGKKLLDIAAPIAGSILLPGIGTALGATAGGGLMTGLGAAGGALGGAAQGAKGKSLLFDAVGGGISPNIGDIANAVSSGTGDVASQISQAVGLGGDVATAGGEPVGQAVTIGSAPGAFANAPGVSLPSLSGAGTGAAAAGGTDINSLIQQAVGQGGSTAGSTAGAVASSGGGIMDTLKSAIKGISPLQAVSAGGLALDELKGNKQSGAEKSAQNNAQSANQIASNLQTGTLTAGQQGIVDSQVEDEITRIRSKYAGLGLSGSTMERQEIDAAHQQGALLGQNLANTAASGSLAALGASDSIYQTLMQNALSSDQDLMKALAEMAGSGGASTAKAT